MATKLLIVFPALLCAAAPAALAADKLPALPKMALGVNQIGVKGFVLTDPELDRLKSEGTNTYRFPLWPHEIGLDDKLVSSWENGETWDEQAANRWPVDWQPVDALLDKLAAHGLTPYICPHPDPPGARIWSILHIPEAAERTFWFTKLVAKHVHEKYGDNVIYGWYENIYWTSQPRTLGTRFAADWHKILRTMYPNIGSLNRTWKGQFKSFDEVPVPELRVSDAVLFHALENRATYDLRRAIDLLQREKLKQFRQDLRTIAPGAIWAGGCLHDFEGMYDLRESRNLRMNPSITTHAITSDVLAFDSYKEPKAMAVHYRTVAKIAAEHKKKLFAVEIQAHSAPSYDAVASIGGPAFGALAWDAKEDWLGLFKMDGTPCEEYLKLANGFFRKLQTNPATYSTYRPGQVHIYYPEETYEYMALRSSNLDAYDHACDAMKPSDLEPVLTDELYGLPKDVPLFVVEKHLPRRGIDELIKREKQVVCPHPFYVDENGARIERRSSGKDFYARLAAVKGGPALKEAFLRVEDKDRNVAYADLGATATTPSELAQNDAIATDRPNRVENCIDGDSFGFTFAGKGQSQIIDVHLPRLTDIDGVFVQLYAGDTVNPPCPVPASVRISGSQDGTRWTELAAQKSSSVRIRARFSPVKLTHVRFDFGEAGEGRGLSVTQVGVLAN